MWHVGSWCSDSNLRLARDFMEMMLANLFGSCSGMWDFGSRLTTQTKPRRREAAKLPQALKDKPLKPNLKTPWTLKTTCDRPTLKLGP